MTPKKAAPVAQPESIVGRAVLVDLSISAWTARKKDRKVTDRVNAEYAADADAGNYWKKLFGGSSKLGKVQGCITALRMAHYNQTLPWTDEGWRLLPTENYFEYAESVRKARAALEQAVDDMIAAYPKMIAVAKEKLNGMFDKSDYPTAEEARRKFRVSINYAPLPVGEDFRVSLPQKELKQMMAAAEERLTEATEVAMEGAWKRLGDAVHHLREYLGSKNLKDTMIANVRGIAEALGRLNVTKDSTLERVRAQVLQDLAVLDAGTLRKDEKAADTAATKADAILKQMKSVYSPPKKEAK